MPSSDKLRKVTLENGYSRSEVETAKKILARQSTRTQAEAAAREWVRGLRIFRRLQQT